MTNFMDYLRTDWAAMTLNDWLGVFYAVMAVVVMTCIYVIALHPKNKEELNGYGDMVLREEEQQNLGGQS